MSEAPRVTPLELFFDLVFVFVVSLAVPGALGEDALVFGAALAGGPKDPAAAARLVTPADRSAPSRGIKGSPQGSM